MEVKSKEVDGVSIASLVGKLDSASAGDVQDAILDTIVSGTKLVFDLGECSFVSSAGLRVLLIFAKRVKSESASAAIASVSEEILEVMEMTGFDDMFDTYATVDEAVSALK